MDRRLRASHGFTLIEVLVAMLLLVVALGGTFALVNAANARATNSQGREAATNLAREISEQIRTLSYSELTPALLTLKLQALPGLGDASAAAGWQLPRRGLELDVTTSVCSIDDRNDGFGDHSTGTWCPDSSQQDNADGRPEDLKRAVVTVAYTERERTTTIRLATTINSTGQTTGLPVTALELARTEVANAPIASPTEPVVTTEVERLVFRATAPAAAAKVIWSIEGVRGAPDATFVTPGWEFKWVIKDTATGRYVSDGVYSISAQAQDAKGEVGPAREMPVRLARGAPAAPQDLAAGYNSIRVAGAPTSVAELQWLRNTERNVVGYRVYRGTTLVCPRSGPALTDPPSLTVLNPETACIDPGAPPLASSSDTERTYTVHALYYNAAGALTQGPASTPVVARQATRASGASTMADKLHRFKFHEGTVSPAGPGQSCDSPPGYLAPVYKPMSDAVFGPAGSKPGIKNETVTFCSPPLAAGKLYAQTVNARLPVQKSSGGKCTLSAALYRRGAGAPTLLATFPPVVLESSFAATPPATWDPAIAETPLAADDRLSLSVKGGSENACGGVTISYGGTTNPGTLDIRAQAVIPSTTTVPNPPDPPTGLTTASLGDGTSRLSWNRPTTGGTVAFYRIYSVGTNYTHRVDTTGDGSDATETYDVPTGSGPYHVTAVDRDLFESTPVGPVAP